MGRLQLRRFDSIRQIRDAAAAWDRLWQRSNVTLPTARAELVAQWLEHFAPRAAIDVLVVEDEGEFMAALPLVGRRERGLLPVGDLTWNYWSPNGELLLDPAADAEAVCDLLAAAMGRLPWPLLWLELVPFETSHWQAMIRALAARRLATELHPRYRIGQVDVRGDFEEYFAGRPKSHRRAVGKALRRLEKSGPVELKVYSQFTDKELEACLRRAFDIEQRSWKQEAGGTVLGTPGMFEFYRRQARQLAQWGFLRVAFLEHRTRPIAFELGWTAKGVYHSFKVGYDPGSARYGPGHVLRMRLVESLCRQPGQVTVDFQGPLTDALSRWSTGSYPIGRLVVAPQRPSSRALLAGYRAVAPVIRRLRPAAGESSGEAPATVSENSSDHADVVADRPTACSPSGTRG